MWEIYPLQLTSATNLLSRKALSAKEMRQSPRAADAGGVTARR
jgi:hypothetical protein